MKLFIDADYIVYKCCAVTETEIDWGDDVIMVVSKFSDAYKNTIKEIEKIGAAFYSATDTILFFSDSVNFRKSIFPDYKGHRNRKKPCGYRRVIEQLKTEYKVVRMDTLEADDALGIYATRNPGNVICSPDKDMKQIPGMVYDLQNLTEVTEEEGAAWHLIQTMAGDQTDGYSGVPGIGVKRAVALLEENGYSWATVVKAFEEKGLDEDVALMNARLARILTDKDYDFELKQPILWTPSSDYRIDNRAAVQTTEDAGLTT